MYSVLRSIIALFSGCVAAAFLVPASGLARPLVLAEPVHYVGFLPVYVALKNGYFRDEGIELQISTMAGASMISTVASGQAFALLASVDRAAEAKVNGKVMKAVVSLNGRANIYLMARKGVMPVTGDIASFLRGKRIAVTSFGGTPNSMLRYLLGMWRLAPDKDVTLVEVSSQAVVPVTVAARQADVGVSAEPFMSQGIRQGIWGGPIYNTAKELGPYADTALIVSGDSIQNEPMLVRGMVKALMRGLVYTYAHQSEMVAFSKAEFPTASQEDLEASLGRAFADGIYSDNGFLPSAAWDSGEAVIRQAGVLKQHVPYDDVVDMRFVLEVQKELGLH